LKSIIQYIYNVAVSLYSTGKNTAFYLTTQERNLTRAGKRKQERRYERKTATGKRWA
jgi:hypothetical protein